jgi:DNA-binding response OmpR family regulator
MKDGRVLVVDDEPMVRETLGQVLTDEGYVVDLAVDGESALDRVRVARPDVILLDLMMPGMNGRQFLAALRAEPDYAALPVMIMTAVHGLGVNPTSLGASEVVEKPFNIDELLNKVAFAIYRTRATRRPPTAPIAIPDGVDPAARRDRGVVLLVEHDRGRLQQLDSQLTASGFTVVSMTRALVQLSRLARALRPRAMLLDARCPGTASLVSDLADTSGMELMPVLVFARDAGGEIPGALAHAADADLIAFVEAQPERKPLR